MAVVVGALITGTLALVGVAWQVNAARKQNTLEHGIVADHLLTLHETVDKGFDHFDVRMDRVEDKVDGIDGRVHDLEHPN